MTTDTPPPLLTPITPCISNPLAERANAIREQVAKAFIGQDDVLDLVMVALLAGGHVLLLSLIHI